MRVLVASTLAALMAAAALVAAPATSEPTTKTELIDESGQSVAKIVLRHDFNSLWLIDNKNLLWRDNSRTYFLVTLKEACTPLDIRGRSLTFRPEGQWQLIDTRQYEIRPLAGEDCAVARIEKMNDARGDEVRATTRWRIW